MHSAYGPATPQKWWRDPASANEAQSAANNLAIPLGAIGQFETEIRAERQMDGIKKAKDRGVQFGKRPALTENQIIELRDKRASGALIKDLMADYRLSKATIYRHLSENEARTQLQNPNPALTPYSALSRSRPRICRRAMKYPCHMHVRETLVWRNLPFCPPIWLDNGKSDKLI